MPLSKEPAVLALLCKQAELFRSLFVFIGTGFPGLQLFRYSRETAAPTAKRFPCAAMLLVKSGDFKVFV